MEFKGEATGSDKKSQGQELIFLTFKNISNNAIEA